MHQSASRIASLCLGIYCGSILLCCLDARDLSYERTPIVVYRFRHHAVCDVELSTDPWSAIGYLHPFVRHLEV